jgi:hypothetical protein
MLNAIGMLGVSEMISDEKMRAADDVQIDK